MSEEIKIKCGKCQKSFTSKFVSTWKTTKNSIQHLCRDCIKNKQRKYSATPQGRLSIIEASNRAYLKHKSKWIARAKARYAVKVGKLNKPKKCEVCEKIKSLQGHHEDYSKPLDVVWLCSGCHAEADRLLEIKVK